MQVVKTLHYCKADKHTGKPIIVTSMKEISEHVQTIKRRNTDKFIMNLYDKNGKPVQIRMQFRNAKGKAKKSGATTVLEICR